MPNPGKAPVRGTRPTSTGTPSLRPTPPSSDSVRHTTSGGIDSGRNQNPAPGGNTNRSPPVNFSRPRSLDSNRPSRTTLSSSISSPPQRPAPAGSATEPGLGGRLRSKFWRPSDSDQSPSMAASSGAAEPPSEADLFAIDPNKIANSVFDGWRAECLDSFIILSSVHRKFPGLPEIQVIRNKITDNHSRFVNWLIGMGNLYQTNSKKMVEIELYRTDEQAACVVISLNAIANKNADVYNLARSKDAAVLQGKIIENLVKCRKIIDELHTQLNLLRIITPRKPKGPTGSLLEVSREGSTTSAKSIQEEGSHGSDEASQEADPAPTEGVQRLTISSSDVATPEDSPAHTYATQDSSSSPSEDSSEGSPARTRGLRGGCSGHSNTASREDSPAPEQSNSRSARTGNPASRPDSQGSDSAWQTTSSSSSSSRQHSPTPAGSSGAVGPPSEVDIFTVEPEKLTDSAVDQLVAECLLGFGILSTIHEKFPGLPDERRICDTTDRNYDRFCDWLISVSKHFGTESRQEIETELKKVPLDLVVVLGYLDCIAKTSASVYIQARS